jgi:hypothetical protein
MLKALSDTVPPDADPSEVGKTLVDVAAQPYGKRPFRTVIDPASDGAAVSFAVIDRIREQFLQRIVYPELLQPIRAFAPEGNVP